MWLWLSNAVAASLLNISSFEAVKRCGPLSMGIASNLKQVVILLIDVSYATNGSVDTVAGKPGAVLGSLMTVIGGVWYAFARAASQYQKTPVL